LLSIQRWEEIIHHHAATLARLATFARFLCRSLLFGRLGFADGFR